MTNATNKEQYNANNRIIIMVAALVIIAAGLKSAQEIMVPLLLAAFISTIAATPMFWIRARGVPAGLALGLVVIGIFVFLLLLAAVATQSTSAFIAKLPFYQERLLVIQNEVATTFVSAGVGVDLPNMLNSLPISSALSFAGATLSSLGNLLSNGFLIILTVIFILAEATSFYPKLSKVLSDPERDLVYFTRFTTNMNSYIAIKTSMSLITGFLVTICLWFLKIDFAVLWGLLAFLLNFIPTIGSIFAAIPPLLLALVQFSPATAGAVALIFFVINMAVGNILEPRFMGKGLDLSTLIVFLSLIFWGWILGTVGMFLSVPLTMTGKLALEANPKTLWLAQLLGQADSKTITETLVAESESPNSPPLNKQMTQESNHP
jgi:predicted PurR-regulated permease PerM